jgi:hypothetical protein
MAWVGIVVAWVGTAVANVCLAGVVLEGNDREYGQN